MGMISAKDLMATASSSVFDNEDPVVAGEQSTDMTQGTASVGAQETADNVATEGVEAGGSSVMQPPVQAAAPPSAPPVETVEENFDDLPLDELITNANWKARKVGYSKLASDLEGLEGEQAAESDLLDLYFNRCVEESSMGALDAGLDCAKLMVGSIYQNKDGAELVSQNIPKLFKKALVGRPGSKKRAIDLILEMMAVDKDCMHAALDTLRAGVKDKSPKVSAGCVQCCREAVVAFGPKRVTIQGALPVVVDAMSVKAATTRQEATKLAIDVNVRLNGAFQDLVLNSMENDASQKQLATALDKAKEQDKPDPEELKPTRKFRGEAENADEADDGGDDTDLWSMLPEVAILERLKPIKFESRIQEAKWAERKRAIEDVTSMCGTPPRLAQGDYHALVFALKGLIQNDSNQAVCVAAIQLLGVLGSGLRSHFHAAARSCLPLLLSQYRINKRPLLHAVDQTLDTFAQFCLNLTEEKVVPVLKDNLSTDGDGGKLKSTPFQRFNILTWLARCIQSGWLWSATHHEPLERDGFDQIISLLVDGTSDADSKVRDVAARCVGDMTALESGDGTGKMPPYCHAKAEETLEKVLTANPKLKSKVFGGTLKKTKSGTSPTGPTTSPVEATASKSKPTKQLTPNGADETSAAALAGTAAPAAPAPAAVPKRRTGPQKGSVSLGTSQSSADKDVEDSGEATMDLETATTVVMGLEVAGLEEAVATFDGATKWQDKVHIFTELDNFVKGAETLTCEQTKALIVYIGNRTKEFKEANFNIMNVAWGLLAGAISKAESTTPLPKCYAAYVLEPALKKLGDRKQSPQVQELTLVLCEACGPRYICQKLLVYGGKQASPKALEDLFTLFASIAADFGAQTLDLKAVVELCSGPKGVGSRLPPPKNASIACITELFRQVGEPVAQLLPDSAAKVMSGKLEGVQVEGLAKPKRGVKTASAANGGEEAASAPSVGDLIPRADISPLLTAKLLHDIGDESTRESWKLRMKAIDDVNEIVKSAKGRALLTREVKSTMSELRKRFNDSNRNLATKAIGVMGLIANSVGGEGAATLTKGNVEPLLRCLGDIKKTVVAATSKTLELWTVHEGSVCRAAFLAILQQCPEVLMDSKLDRKVVLSWYIKHFPFDQATATSEERDAVSDLTKALLSILQSRDPLHRKLSTEAITTTVRFLGIEEGEAIMQSHCRDLKPAVARGLVPLLKQAYTAAGGEVASSVDSKPAPARGAGATSKRSNTTVSPPQGRQRSVVGERNRSSTIAVAERPQSVSAAVDRNNDPAVEQTPLEAAADECPTFKSVPSTLRDRREEKGKRNRWPTMFDEKDTHRMMEYNQALKDDMDKVVSSELLSLMFTDADRGRAARGSALDPAFQTLGFEMQKYANEVMECFDLLLKWSTIQLMNNNSTVTNHVLAFIEQLFDLAAGADYKLSDYEAAAFLPHLLTKLGEKQKRFRDAVRGIMAQVCQVFPYSKYLVYVFAEVSPNQRSMYVLSECLDELARLISTHGLSLLRVKIGVGQNLLRTVVPLVGDSRKEVRAAAMLVIEAVWEHCERNSDMLNKLFTQHKAIPSDKVKTMIEKHMQSCQSKMPQVLVEAREEPKSQIPSRSPLNTAHQQPSQQATTSRTLRLNHREPSSPSSKQKSSSRLSLALPESPKTPEMDDRRGRTRSSRLSLSALGRELDLPSTPPSPSDRKRPSSPLEPPPPLVFDDKENEGGLSTDAVAHMVDAEASPSKPAHKTISSVDSFAQALRQVEQDARGYLNVLQTKSDNDEGAVRDRGIKALALIGSQSSPDGWSEAGLGGQAEWVKLIRTHVNTGRLVLVVLDMLSGITEADPLPYASMDEGGKHATNQELRMLKLTLPTLLTLAWWPELRSAATSDPAIGERWVSTMCDLISRLIQQRVQQQVSVEPTSEYLHEITTERNKILKSAQTVFAKLSEGSSWLPAVIKRICKCNEVWRVLQHTGGPRAEQELRLKKVLRSSLREYAALQVSFHEAYANIATDDVVAALDNIVSVGLVSTDAESAEDRAAIEDLVYSLSRNGPLLKVDLKRVPELNAFVSDVIQRRDDGKLSEQDKLALSEIFSNLSLAINESDIQLRDASLAQLGEFDSRHPSFNARAYMATSSVSGWFRDYVVEELEKQRNIRNGGTPKENQAFQSPKITKISNAAPLEESSTNVNVSSIRERLGKLRKEYVTGSNSTPKASMPRSPHSEPSSPMSSKVVPPPLPERPKASAMVSEKVAESPAREPVSASNTLETIRERMAARRRAAAAAAALNS